MNLHCIFKKELLQLAIINSQTIAPTRGLLFKKFWAPTVKSMSQRMSRPSGRMARGRDEFHIRFMICSSICEIFFGIIMSGFFNFNLISNLYDCGPFHPGKLPVSLIKLVFLFYRFKIKATQTSIWGITSKTFTLCFNIFLIIYYKGLFILN